MAITGSTEALAREIAEYLELPTSLRLSPAHQTVGYDIDAGNRQIRLSIRDAAPDVPCHLVDFLGEPHSPGAELVIVYTGATATHLEDVDASFVPPGAWKRVSHLYWSGADVTPGSTPPPHRDSSPQAEAPSPRGGRRLQEGAPRTPRFSIITIVRNGAKTIEQTIQSVITQKGDDTEYLIIDGGSTDGTLDIVSRYREHIDYWQSEPDDGIYDALNKAISLCRGEFIGAIHANDYYEPGAIEAIRETVTQHPDSEFIYGNLRYLGGRRHWVRGGEIGSTHQMVMYSGFNHPTCFISRAAYVRLGGYDQTYTIAGDYDLGLRFWNAGVRFRYVNRVISAFRLGGVSSSLFANQWERHCVRLANGVGTAFSLAILALVLGNYCLKTPLRWWRR